MLMANLGPRMTWLWPTTMPELWQGSNAATAYQSGAQWYWSLPSFWLMLWWNPYCVGYFTLIWTKLAAVLLTNMKNKVMKRPKNTASHSSWWPLSICCFDFWSTSVCHITRSYRKMGSWIQPTTENGCPDTCQSSLWMSFISFWYVSCHSGSSTAGKISSKSRGSSSYILQPIFCSFWIGATDLRNIICSWEILNLNLMMRIIIEE